MRAFKIGSLLFPLYNSTLLPDVRAEFPQLFNPYVVQAIFNSAVQDMKSDYAVNIQYHLTLYKAVYFFFMLS